MESGRSKTKGKQANVRKWPNEIYMKQNLSKEKRGPGLRTMSTMWNNRILRWRTLVALADVFGRLRAMLTREMGHGVEAVIEERESGAMENEARR